VGKLPAGADPQAMLRTLVTNLRFTADALARVGLRLLIAPINTFDIPGFAFSRTEQALDLLDEVGAGHTWLEYDLHHAQRMEGEMAATLSRHLHRSGHVRLADNPGRHELGKGELNNPFCSRTWTELGTRAGWAANVSTPPPLRRA
jgi:hydroxypyruvate isomerase